MRGLVHLVLGVAAFSMMLIQPFTPAATAYASDKEVEEITLGTPKHAWWESDTVGKWTSVKKAHEYQVKLYIADDVEIEYNENTEKWAYYYDDDEGADPLDAVAVIRTGETSCDFSEYMKDQHSYFFVVRATPRVSEMAYVNNGSWKVSPEIDFRGKLVQGITTGKWRNYLEGSRYDTGEGEYLTDGWQLIYGKWYYLADGGYRQTGWCTVDDETYYLDEYGVMATGWFYQNDSWYYANKSGVVQTGWVMPQPGKYYYLYEDGTMAVDTWIDDYYVGSDGLRVS